MKCPMLATAILALAHNLAQASDFSGRWVGKTEGILSTGAPANICDVSMTINQAEASYTQALKVICGDIGILDEDKTLMIRGNDLLLEGALIGSLTDSDIDAAVYYGRYGIVVRSQGSLKDTTLHLTISFGAPGTPDPVSMGAALKRVGP